MKGGRRLAFLLVAFRYRDLIYDLFEEACCIYNRLLELIIHGH